MKKTMLMMLSVVALVVGAASAQALEVTNGGSVLQVTPTLSNSGKDFGVGFYLNTTLKLGANWTLTPEYLAGVDFVANSKSDVSASFGFLRFLVGGPKLAEWGEGKAFKLSYRYMAPLDRASQIAGNYGTVGVRPEFTWTFTEKLGLLVRSMTSLNLVRNGYNYNKPAIDIPSSYKGVVGNTLVSTSPEVVLSYDFTDKFGVYTYWAAGFGFKGKAKGASEHTWAKILSHQHAVTYAVNDKWVLEAGVLNENIPLGKGFKLMAASNNQYYVEGTYKF